MVNINLTTAKMPSQKETSYKKGITSIVIACILLLGGYGWLAITTSKISDDIKAANSVYDVEYAKLANDNKDVIDFQNRIMIAKNLLTEKNVALESLAELEKDVIPGVYLDLYNYNGKGVIILDMVADNFDILAKQISNFKKANYFSGLSFGKSSLNDKGKVKTTLNLKVN